MCPELPAGCDVSIRRVTYSEWIHFVAVHRFQDTILFAECMVFSTLYQCHILGADDRRHQDRRVIGTGHFYYPKDPKGYVLYLAIVGGQDYLPTENHARGVLLASCIVQETISDQPRWWRVQLLCSATHTGGGIVLMQAIQRECLHRNVRGIRLESSDYQTDPTTAWTRLQYTPMGSI